MEPTAIPALAPVLRPPDPESLFEEEAGTLLLFEASSLGVLAGLLVEVGRLDGVLGLGSSKSSEVTLKQGG